MDYKDYKQKGQTLHFWHHARLFFLEKLLQSKFFEFKSGRKILDIGCGTGTELEILQKFGQVCALDKNESALAIARKQSAETLLINLEKEKIPADAYDAVCAFDIIEHIQKDETALHKIYDSLKPEGYLFLTVPAFPFLFGPHDIALEHIRRYNKKELLEKLEQAGFKIEIINYWNFLLFLPEASFRIIKKYSTRFFKKTNKPESKIPPALLNFLLYQILKIDSRLSLTKNLPYGLSLFVIAKK